MESDRRPSRPEYRLVADDQAAVAFSVVWTAALVPSILLLASPAAVPLVLVPPVARMAMRWSAFRAFVRGQSDGSNLAAAIESLEVPVRRTDGATPLRRLRRALTAVAGTGIVAWIATTTAMGNVGFTPLLGQVAVASLLAMAVGGSSALLVAAGESFVERRPLLDGVRRRVHRWWAELQLRCLPVAAPPDRYLSEALATVDAMLDHSAARPKSPVPSPR
jgi:hypothetical protein